MKKEMLAIISNFLKHKRKSLILDPSAYGSANSSNIKRIRYVSLILDLSAYGSPNSLNIKRIRYVYFGRLTSVLVVKNLIPRLTMFEDLFKVGKGKKRSSGKKSGLFSIRLVSVLV